MYSKKYMHLMAQIVIHFIREPVRDEKMDKEIQKKITELDNQMQWNWIDFDDFVEGETDKVCLDGYFTLDHIKQIYELMKEIKEKNTRP
jgi:hypothetical protein